MYQQKSTEEWLREETFNDGVGQTIAYDPEPNSCHSRKPENAKAMCSLRSSLST